MVKKTVALFAILLMLFTSLNVISLASNDQNSTQEKYSQQMDRQDKEANKVVDTVTANSDSAIEKNKEALDLRGNANKTKSSGDDPLENVSNSSYKLAFKILNIVQELSLPVCALVVIIGAMIYFILGPRNMIRKKFGLMLMFGAFTFLTIAKIAPILFMVLIQQ